MATTEPNKQFEARKRDHIRLSLSEKNQAKGESGLDRVLLTHEALPDLNFSETDISQTSLKKKYKTPFLVSSMTGGHQDSTNLNLLLAKACAHRGWRMGVGSQRKELANPEAAAEWRSIRKAVPGVSLLGNLGIAQLIQTKTSAVEKLVEALEAEAMIVHLNALQEVMQPEGTTNFKGGFKALERLAKTLSVPVIVKETGCGFSKATLKKLKATGVKAVDVSGLGGTHWGRIEGARASQDSVQATAAKTFANWGVSTVESVCNAVDIRPKYEIWASGGVRSGLDAAKLLALGANTVGFAQAVLEAAVAGEGALLHRMDVFEYELRTVLFCTGSKNIADLALKKVCLKR